ncbi:MAG: hypothetical protein KDK54_09410 [Leptospiraceae bacterium]|nr:hypothetical protein [Leptospiraceae bacterium]
MKKLIFIYFITVFSFGLYPNSEILKECKTEQKEFCSSVKGAKAKVVQCLLDNESELSGDCKISLKSSFKKLRSTKSSNCRNDIDQYCKWIVPGGGRILKCLFENEENLSSECKKTLNEL